MIQSCVGTRSSKKERNWAPLFFGGGGKWVLPFSLIPPPRSIPFGLDPWLILDV